MYKRVYDKTTNQIHTEVTFDGAEGGIIWLFSGDYRKKEDAQEVMVEVSPKDAKSLAKYLIKYANMIEGENE